MWESFLAPPLCVRAQLRRNCGVGSKSDPLFSGSGHVAGECSHGAMSVEFYMFQVFMLLRLGKLTSIFC